MKQVATICVYGDFKDGDIRIKVFPSGRSPFQFQNILHEAGYDAKLFGIAEEELKTEED